MEPVETELGEGREEKQRKRVGYEKHKDEELDGGGPLSTLH